MQDKLTLLKTVNLFVGASDEDLIEVVDLFEEVEVQAGEKLFEKGDSGTDMYILIDGRVRVHSRELTLGYHKKGAIFGEMALLDLELRTASVTALEDSYLLSLSREQFHGLMASHTDVALGIIRLLVRRLHTVIRDIVQDFEYLQKFARVTAMAAGVEASVYESVPLEEVIERTDTLGQLARASERMAREVYAREQHLRQQVQRLGIEVDQVKRVRQVTDITETDYFHNLREQAAQLRAQWTE